MNLRTNQSVAMAVDLAVILLPAIGTQEAARMLWHHNTPLRVAIRVLATRRRRNSAVRAS
jgi:hypothetical protein